MDIIQIGIFYFLVIFFTLIFIIQAILAFPRKFRKKYISSYSPRTLIIIPAKGVDFGLQANLESIKSQNYKDYSIICVVDSEEDDSLKYIEDAGLKHVVSTYNSSGSGKVRAIATAIEKFRDFEVYVVADTDIRVSPQWLINLVRPLSIDDYGVSTTFPYFRSEGKFWSKFKTVWGFVGRGMMESEITVFGWGGSMAFKRELLDGKMDEFASDISDDMAVTRICKEKGLRIAYVPESTPDIYSPDDWPTFREWSVRQTSLLVSRNKDALKIGILLYGSMCLLIVASLVFSIFVSYFYLIWLIPLLISEIKIRSRLRDRGFQYYLAGLLMPFFYTWNLYLASRTHKIVWRGTEYKL
jgi:hypothetical protein